MGVLINLKIPLRVAYELAVLLIYSTVTKEFLTLRESEIHP